MGDKSPKSKQRDEKQKQSTKSKDAADARAKHAGFTFGQGTAGAKGKK